MREREGKTGGQNESGRGNTVCVQVCVCVCKSVCVCMKEREGVRGEVREQGILTEGDGSVQLTSLN